MSVMQYDIGRRYAHNLSFQDYYVNDRNVPLTYSQRVRDDPRGYPMGGPVGGPRGRPGVGRDEPTIENGPVRRRIAVAVSVAHDIDVCNHFFANVTTTRLSPSPWMNRV